MPTAPGRRRVAVRRSAIHGRGVYAAIDLAAGVQLFEYRGTVITWAAAIARWDRSDDPDGVTYFFDLGDGRVIDGGDNGNSARFVNHGCEPNCEAIERTGRVWIHTTQPVRAGAELLLDYALIVDEPDDPDLRELYACGCGAPTCRATMLAVDPATASR